MWLTCCWLAVTRQKELAIHSTALGPALGGLRMWPYASEAEALQDALRLARGIARLTQFNRSRRKDGAAGRYFY